ncbi:hypothetical protein YG5714_0427 [Sulfolobus islandicus Y.G.57.14]|jgi:hypothetical protein|uniref:Uncharacterized protein n=2 Tax=Saccharolobus islandicus TaxID=43080 RepID=C3NA35_SACI7|nr:hypothetical protein [Sulfolobus islandicus]ACP44719.1 hypothetical protein YG5714_0427 [Sulfolobus islandicus Y.G.57.14]ADB86238.1 hypothetical protein LD85_0465 [Sulfolobus islandicus L.D.8.5]PVU76925.1 hypothetical protein DDW12_08870 [Sulfolobus islandicus]
MRIAEDYETIEAFSTVEDDLHERGYDFVNINIYPLKVTELPIALLVEEMLNSRHDIISIRA